MSCHYVEDSWCQLEDRTFVKQAVRVSPGTASVPPDMLVEAIRWLFVFVQSNRPSVCEFCCGYLLHFERCT